MAKAKSIQSAFIEKLGGRPVLIHPKMVKALGSVNAAIIMCQLLYWLSSAHKLRPENPYIYKTVAELETETGLRRRQQELAIKICVRKGVLKVWLHGIPPKRHFFVYVMRLKELCGLTVELNGLESQQAQDVPVNSSSGAVQIAPNVPINTESTTESTQDINKINKLRLLKEEALSQTIYAQNRKT